MPQKSSASKTTGTMTCPDCGSEVSVGFGGAENLAHHREGGRCQKNRKKLEASKALGRSQAVMKGFLVPKKQLVTPTVSAPAVISQVSVLANSSATSTDSEMECKRTTKHPVIDSLRRAVSRLPSTTPKAAQDGPLARFCGLPHVDEGESAWETYDGPLNTIFQASSDTLSGLVESGEWGVHGLLEFLEALVVVHGVDECLLEGKVERMIKAIDLFVTGHSVSPSTMESDGFELVDSVKNAGLHVFTSMASPINCDGAQSIAESTERRCMCEGLKVEVPGCTSAHTSYPSELHVMYGDPWNYAFMEGQLVLRARNCEWKVSAGTSSCKPCLQLQTDTRLEGILQCMREGVHVNAPYKFQSHQGLVTILRAKNKEIQRLRLGKLNDADKLATKARLLGIYEQFVMAVGSGKVERVDRLVRVKSARGYGIAGLMSLYDRAAQKVYSPKNYTEVDKLRAIVFWRLGGGRLAEIMHRSMGLPSLNTLRAASTIPALEISVSYPTVLEVKANVIACFDPMQEVIRMTQTLFQVLMLDELSIEQRPRWNDHNNDIVGLCREHGQSTTLQLCMEKEVDLLIDALGKKEVHMAVEATVGAIGVISEETQVYGARPILVSGSCKSETGAQHAQLIKAAYEGAKETKLRTISIASDGESRRGDALIRLTMKTILSSSLNIYPLLYLLPLLNLEVGDDDITADKDYKHIFKRLRNLLLREKGTFIHGVHITPSVIKVHLRHHGISEERIKYLLNPSDKQDVKLAFDLLHAIWTLPSISAEDNSVSPSFRDARLAFKTLGSLFRHILMPYICVDLSLSEQLTHLSAAAHLLIVLVVETASVLKVMPTQLYTDIMIMIKNAYFCVAKAKVDAPDSKFWLILLGTDRLEVLFGILRTMVGNDANVDIYQLGARLTGTTEVSTILATHPEWDHAPRRLKLPILSKDSFEIHNSVDHVNPASWRGDVHVRNVILQTSWKLGRQSIEQHFPDAAKILRDVSNGPNDMFSPLGVSLVHMSGHTDDVDETYESHSNLSTGAEAMGHEVEDLIALEDLNNQVTPYIEVGGSRISKAKYLNNAFDLFKKPGSRDRLKRVADGQRYNTGSLWKSDSHSRSTYLAEDLLEIDVPVATVIWCEDKLFACIGEVKAISYDSESLEEIPLEHLREPLSSITFQMLYLAPALLEDSDNGRMDWRWTRVRGKSYTTPGMAVLPINPELSATGSAPYYLFDSKSIMGIGMRILERLSVHPDVHQKIPKVQPTNEFPYCESSGKACFVCEHDGERSIDHVPGRCPQCTPPVLLPHSAPRVLEHNAAHILYDSKMDRSLQYCGLCLRPAPVCVFYLKKGKGANAKPQVDYSKSSCANPLEFRYTNAEESKEGSPSSNVPLPCPKCPRGSPAIWRYNMRRHLIEEHPTVNLAEFEYIWKITEAEKMQLKQIWNARNEVKQRRKARKSKSTTLQISEAHSTRLALHGSDVDDGHICDGEAENANSGAIPDIGDEWSSSDIDHDEPDDSKSAAETVPETDVVETAVDFEEAMNDVEMAMHQNLLDMEGTSQYPTPPSPHFLSTVVEGIVEPTVEPIVEPIGEHVVESAIVGPPIVECDIEPIGGSSEESSAGYQALNNNNIVPEQSNDPSDNLSSFRRSTRKRKCIDFKESLELCTCGEKIARAPPPDEGVIMCAYKGCETQWYHLECVDLEYSIQNWFCEACRGSAGNNSVAAVKRSRV